MIKENNIKTHSKDFYQSFEPKEGCGFSLQFIPIPHRSELGDTAAIIIKGNEKNILFMPDQDSWEETLEHYSKENIRDFLKMFDIIERYGMLDNDETLSFEEDEIILRIHRIIPPIINLKAFFKENDNIWSQSSTTI